MWIRGWELGFLILIGFAGFMLIPEFTHFEGRVNNQLNDFSIFPASGNIQNYFWWQPKFMFASPVLAGISKTGFPTALKGARGLSPYW
jgi:hypothetical protein